MAKICISIEDHETHNDNAVVAIKVEGDLLSVEDLDRGEVGSVGQYAAMAAMNAIHQFFHSRQGAVEEERADWLVGEVVEQHRLTDLPAEASSSREKPEPRQTPILRLVD